MQNASHTTGKNGVVSVSLEKVRVECYARIHIRLESHATYVPRRCRISKGWKADKAPLACQIAGERSARVAEAAAGREAFTHRCDLWGDLVVVERQRLHRQTVQRLRIFVRRAYVTMGGIKHSFRAILNLLYPYLCECPTTLASEQSVDTS